MGKTLKPLRVLLIEDSEEDALLILYRLRYGGYEPVFERVYTPEAMNAALDKQAWDIIISDFSMPRFNGIDALLIMKRRGLDIPFIVVSGQIGEEIAVKMMKSGAHDYIMKDKLSRLAPAIERELGDATIRKEHKIAERQILQSKLDWEATFDAIPDMITIQDKDFNILHANETAKKILGLPELETDKIFKCYKYFHGEDSMPEECPSRECVKTGKAVVIEKFEPHLNRFIEIRALPRFDENNELIGLIHIVRDITKQKFL